MEEEVRKANRQFKGLLLSDFREVIVGYNG